MDESLANGTIVGCGFLGGSNAKLSEGISRGFHSREVRCEGDV